MNQLLEKQRDFFDTGKTKDYHWRMQALTRLEEEIIEARPAIEEALKKDLHKSSVESYMTEIGMALSEIRFLKKNLKKYMTVKYAKTPIAAQPAKSFVIAEPYGVVLIMAPWNYPFLLTIQPLAGAIAAGNCAVLKPSEYAVETADIIEKIISKAFPKKYVAVVQGDVEENTELLKEKFDFIFFTGSPSVGKIVMAAASKHLTPVCLELGGKSPCIIDETANLSLAAKRVAFGKFLNSGQTCVAPDYVLVHKNVEEKFLKKLKEQIRKMYGKDPLSNPDYPRMVHARALMRVSSFIKDGEIVTGGKVDYNTLQIEPTVLKNVPLTSDIMQEEIFGSVLPVISYKDKKDLEKIIKTYEKPLALYLFTNDKQMERWVLSKFSFGGGCINDTVMHLSNPYIGFGGVGNSGMGSYHGKASFGVFSHKKSILKKAQHFDMPIRYQPYRKWKEILIKKFI